MIPQDEFDKVKILAPYNTVEKFSNYLSETRRAHILPFNGQRIESLNHLSQAILKDVRLRSDSASVALAYWLRRANLQRLKEQFERRLAQDKTVKFVPVGRVFHITPANVDTIFVYSWALSFICGNTNVVRVSSQLSPIVVSLIDCVNGIMEKDDDLRNSNRFIGYEHDENITGAISKWCSHRVVWGGDETARIIHPIDINPHASERIFSSKFSYSVIKSEQFCNVDETGLAKIALDFYNDMFMFDQEACSSPHIVFWVGPKNVMQQAVALFNQSLRQEIKRRKYKASAPQAIKRLNTAFDLACSVDIRVEFQHSDFVSLTKTGTQQLERIICGGGLLTYVQVDSLCQVSEFASEMDQTVTYFGLSENELNQFALDAGSRGVDRVVPIGQALSFTHIWDGYDLISDFTHKVVVVS